MGMQPANKLDPRVKRVWRIHETVGLVFSLALAAVVTYVVQTRFDGPSFASGSAWAVIGVWALVVFQLVYLVVVPPLRYARWRYEVTNTDVILRYGIVVSTSVVIPLVRVQHVESTQGPILKSFDLSSVNISTAGDSFEIPGLGTSEAERLRDQVAVLARIAQEDV